MSNNPSCWSTRRLLSKRWIDRPWRDLGSLDAMKRSGQNLHFSRGESHCWVNEVELTDLDWTLDPFDAKECCAQNLHFSRCERHAECLIIPVDFSTALLTVNLAAVLVVKSAAGPEDFEIDIVQCGQDAQPGDGNLLLSVQHRAWLWKSVPAVILVSVQRRNWLWELSSALISVVNPAANPVSLAVVPIVESVAGRARKIYLGRIFRSLFSMRFGVKAKRSKRNQPTSTLKSVGINAKPARDVLNQSIFHVLFS